VGSGTGLGVGRLVGLGTGLGVGILVGGGGRGFVPPPPLVGGLGTKGKLPRSVPFPLPSGPSFKRRVQNMTSSSSMTSSLCLACFFCTRFSLVRNRWISAAEAWKPTEERAAMATISSLAVYMALVEGRDSTVQISLLFPLDRYHQRGRQDAQL